MGSPVPASPARADAPEEQQIHNALSWFDTAWEQEILFPSAGNVTDHEIIHSPFVV